MWTLDLLLVCWLWPLWPLSVLIIACDSSVWSGYFPGIPSQWPNVPRLGDKLTHSHAGLYSALLSPDDTSRDLVGSGGVTKPPEPSLIASQHLQVSPCCCGNCKVILSPSNHIIALPLPLLHYHTPPTHPDLEIVPLAHMIQYSRHLSTPKPL